MSLKVSLALKEEEEEKLVRVIDLFFMSFVFVAY